MNTFCKLLYTLDIIKKYIIRYILLSIFLSIFSSLLSADVRLYGEITILESIIGSQFLGEIINDTNSPIKYVLITVTSKDSEGKVIDVSYGYVNGLYDGLYCTP